MELPDHYATLGLDRRCTTAQIRSAYRLLAKRAHPDVNGGSPESVERTRALNAAHEILSDPARRRAYDRDLDTAEREEKPAAPAARLERDVSQDAFLRLDEFIRGTVLEVRVNDPGHGGGAEIYRVEIPEETAPGSRLRVERTGGEGWLKLRLRARPGGRFKVRGTDLACELRISSSRAASGGMEMISGVLGTPVRVTIPAGVARGAVVRVPREGLPKPRGGRGDLLVRITYRPEVRIARARF